MVWMVRSEGEFREQTAYVPIREIQVQLCGVGLDVSKGKGARGPLVEVDGIEEPLLLWVPIRCSIPNPLRHDFAKGSLSAVVGVDNPDRPFGIGMI
jgi:hypothetical protein